MVKLICVLAVAMFGSLQLFGQSALKFSEESFDFGNIVASQDALSHSFVFVNSGSDSLGIRNVTSSCDCVVSEWSDKWVKPGDSSRVVINYYPSGRLGDFSRSVTVTDSKGGQTSLLLSGKVIYDEVEIRHLSFGQGALYTKRQKINMGMIYAGEEKKETILISNKGDGTVKLLMDRVVSAPFIAVIPKEEKLKKGEVSQISFRVDAQELKPGYRVDEVTIVTDEEGGDSLKTYYLMSNILPAPEATPNGGGRLTLNADLHDFGLVKQGEILTATFQLMNTGKDVLEVLEVQSNCSCVGVMLPKKRLESFESVELKTYFLTDDRVDNQYKSITVYTNDPDQPTRVIYLKARVQP